LPKSSVRERLLASSIKPTLAVASIPRPEPIDTALEIVMGRGPSDVSTSEGGLWLSGDIADGLARLRWIAGNGNADLIEVEADGKVELNRGFLAKVTGVASGGAIEVMKVVDYLSSNDGLLLLVELTTAICSIWVPWRQRRVRR
jgi:hypothetical protein